MESNLRNAGHFLLQIINVNARFLFLYGAGAAFVHNINGGVVFSDKLWGALVDGRPGTAEAGGHGAVLFNGHRSHRYRRFPFAVIVIPF